MKMKSKIFYKAVICFFVLCIARSSFAATYSANAGITRSQGLTYSAGPIEPGKMVQYIQLKSGKIFGPTDVAGAVNSTYEEVRPAVFPADNDRQVGYDSTLVNQIVPEPTAGKFWHQVNAEANATQAFIVRAWDAIDPTNATSFGESVVFYSQTDPRTPPSNTELSPFKAKFPKAQPGVPSVTSSASQGIGSTPPVVPKLDISIATVLGARYFEVELYRTRSGAVGAYTYADQIGGTDVVYKDAVQTLYDGSEPNIGKSYSLALTDELKTIYFRVRAGNSFGFSATWFEGEQAIPENKDPSIPVAITDLKATFTSPNIVLTWSAPYDKNKAGVQEHCASYDIRVSRDPIVGAPQSPFITDQTNPKPAIDNWDSAKSLTDPTISTLGLTPLAALPVPGDFNNTRGPAETISVTGPALNGNYYFAIKAKDASGNWSYISNVSGVGIGVGGEVERSLTQTFSNIGLGLNTLIITLDPAKGTGIKANDGSGRTVANGAGALTVKKLLVEIIKQAKNKDAVKTFGYFDNTTKGQVGLTVVNTGDETNPVLDTSTPIPSGARNILDDPIVTDQSYGIAVGVTFDLKLLGYK